MDIRPGLIVDAAGAVHESPRPGPLLGAFADSSWHQERASLTDGELLLLYTDGVTEAAGGGGERFGLERLQRLLTDHAGSAPQALLDALSVELERFAGGPSDDDVAALALRPC